MGIYGPWVMDCNHNCRPEIHPIEWMWWLDFSAERPGSPQAKSWMIGLLYDDSKRFRDWTPSPITGQISIPVAFPSGSKAVTAKIEHLVIDSLMPDTFLKGMQVPEQAFWENRDIVLGGQTTLKVTQEGDLPGEAFRWWWGDFYSDPDKGLTFGVLNIAVSAEKIYTGRVTVDFQ